MKRRILIVGSGAREHAFAWKLGQSEDVDSLFVAPGNGGTAEVATNVPLAPTDVAGILGLVADEHIDLTVIGPEAALAAGLSDALQERGHRALGPTRAAAQIETSKSFAKEVMSSCGIPTAGYAVFDDIDDAKAFLAAARYPVVVKADGLAGGKGVAICEREKDAVLAITRMMAQEAFGSSGRRVIIEEYLDGPELSIIALVDGTRLVPFPPAQDHKRLRDADQGPNTGGMGAYAPVPFIDARKMDEFVSLMLAPAVHTLASRGTPFRGFLFCGVILTAEGPKVLEYNARFGDPEAQVLLPLVDGDILPWLDAAADGVLEKPIPLKRQAAVGVVLAAPGYPEAPAAAGLPVMTPGVPQSGPSHVFHAGTSQCKEGLVTTGGRVATVVGMGPSLARAAASAYNTPFSFDGMVRRSDIGWQGLAYEARNHFPCAPGAGVDFFDPAKTGAPPPSDIVSPNSNGDAIVVRGQGSPMPSIVVLAAGGGSNLRALFAACETGQLVARVAGVVSHRQESGTIAFSRELGLPVFPLPFSRTKDYDDRKHLEQRLVEILKTIRPDLVVLAGWMLILSPQCLDQISMPVINVHPALLPIPGATLDIPILRGAHAVRDALELQLPFTGVSVHHVIPEVDSGPVIVRERVDILVGDDEPTLYARIKPVEHRLLIGACARILGSKSSNPDSATPVGSISTVVGTILSPGEESHTN